MSKYIDVQRSIMTTYRKTIWSKFIDSCKSYNLVEENDHICVCISGGKDSFLMAILLKELQKISDVKFKLSFLIMDPGYTQDTLNIISKNLELLEINASIIKSHIFEISTKMGGKPCYLCARMRRGFLYNKAKELGCNKISLGHHFDDVIETILMSMFYNGKIQSMPPKLKADNVEDMILIRPLYKVEEKDIINFRNYNNLEFINCGCMYTASCGNYESKRGQTKRLIKELKKINPIISKNIFNSIHNVCIDTLNGILKQDNVITFNELFKTR